MVLISHESPLDLLQASCNYNDYQYILPTLLKFPEYSQFMKGYKGIKYLDNGLFEHDLKTDDELLELIKEFNPDVFIVPDVWNEDIETLKNAVKWGNMNLNVQLMPVIQATKLSDAILLFTAYKALKFEYIAINHCSIMYESLFPHDNKLVSQCFGRIIFLNELIKMDIIKNTKIHLLGCSLLEEFQYYSKGLIYSVDTSSPIAWGLESGLYNNKKTKPSLKIEDYFYQELDQDQLYNISDNILTFKQSVNNGYNK